MYQSASALRPVLISRAYLCQNCLVNAASQLLEASKLLNCRFGHGITQGQHWQNLLEFYFFTTKVYYKATNQQEQL